MPGAGRLGRGRVRRDRRQGRRALAGARTDPDEAAGYVAATGVDALAVAVGTSHAMRPRRVARPRPDRQACSRAVAVPLVLHGSSGVPDQDLAAAVAAGMTKINIATQLNKVFTAAVRDYLDAEPAVVDPRRYGSAGRDAIAPEVARLLGVIGAAAAGVREEAPVSRYRRWNELLELLATAGQLQVEDAAKALDVSAATIRRDLDELAGQQMLTRIRGGAVAQGVTYDLPLRYKTERHPSEKQRIARRWPPAGPAPARRSA